MVVVVGVVVVVVVVTAETKLKITVSGGRGAVFCSLKSKSAVSQPKAVFSPFKQQKQPHNHPKV